MPRSNTTNLPMRDTIALNEFSREAQRGLENFCRDCDYFPDLENVFEPSIWATLSFLLRRAPDFQEYFPKGKWATIQHLETKLYEWADCQIKLRSKNANP